MRPASLAGVRVLLHADVLELAAAFTSAMAALPAYSATYAPMRGSVAALSARLLACRPFAFYGPQVCRAARSASCGHGAC